VQLGIPGEGEFREEIVRFTNAGSAVVRHAAAHEFAGAVHEHYLESNLQLYNDTLQHFDSVVPNQSMRDSMWVAFMLSSGLSDEELELAKQIYAYSLRTCT
jgi:hypothetical protein